MTGRYEGPPGHDEASPATEDFHDGPPAGTRYVRAAFVLALVIVLGILLLPSATRGPRLPTAAPAPSHHVTTTTTTPTTQPSTTTTVPAVARSAISVLIANGTSTLHGASEVKTFLAGLGFATSAFPPYNTTTPQTSDAIYVVGKGTPEMADQVATALSLGSSVVQATGATPPVQTTTGADVVVVLGSDLATRADAGTLGTAPSATTTTTS